MATITGTSVPLAPHAMVHSWTPLANGDAGLAVEFPEYRDRSVQITGTFGAGGTILVEGSNDGTNYATLTDPQGNALSYTAAKVEAVSEMTRYIRARVSAGDGTTALTVTAYFGRTAR